MPDTDIGQAVITSNTQEDYSVPTETTDGATETKENEYINQDWSQQFGYYKEIPELQAAIDAKATWTVGKGFTADPVTTMFLDTITGWGKDTFNTIIENMIRTYYIGGDAFAEIIRDSNDLLINLKPLDPSSIKIVADSKGRIIRYEQVTKNKIPNKIFEPEDIFHLARNRVADEIHGVSMIKVLENIILMRNEAMSDWKRVLHRNVDPLWIIHADTDDTTKLAGIKSNWESARKDGEVWIVPKGVVTPELVQLAQGASLNPAGWIESLNQYFYQATGGTDIVIGASKDITEASAKIKYLAFQQTIEEEQLYIEEQVRLQLNIVIELTFPASLENEALSDKPKIENRGMEKESAFQPNDMVAEMEGRR